MINKHFENGTAYTKCSVAVQNFSAVLNGGPEKQTTSMDIKGSKY